MPKKHKHHHRSQPPSPDLRRRIERARQEERFQQALDLARQLHKQQPTPANLDLLKDVSLDRARQLRAQGHARDAANLLEMAENLDPASSAWLEKLAVELSHCGEAGKALALLGRLPPDSPVADRVRALAVDAALSHEAAGKSQLPPILHADFERILEAFRQVEAGQDEAARTTLQAISFKSPFLEWKLLLRGLMAYYQNEDERALENWQRLDAERLPARLAAPLRFHLDQAYRAAQPPGTQTALQGQFDRLQGSVLLPGLRRIQAALADRQQESLASVFRQAEGLLPTLRQEAPQAIPRLANCLYWAIIDTGPDDILRFQRVFGSLADDPQFHRLRAIAYERGGDFTEAHKSWQQYEKGIASHPEHWPGDQAVRARALIWRHLADNAAFVPSDQRVAHLPIFLRDSPARPRPLKPGAVECFEKSLELAPDHLDTYEAYFHFLLDEKEESKASKVAERLLERFPNHVATLEEYGDLCLKRKSYNKGLAFLERARQGNPLARHLRDKVSTAHLLLARSHAESGRFEQARPEYEAALELENGSDHSYTLSRWAACEFKAGNTERAEELLAQAHAQAASPLGIAFIMVTEVARLKLPRPLKTRFDREYKEGLAAPPTGAAAAALAQTTAALQHSGISYVGQKTHAKQVTAYLTKALTKVEFTEKQLDQICAALLTLEAMRLAQRYAELGRERFPRSPYFPNYLALSYYIRRRPEEVSPWYVRPLLEEAERLARALPPDDRQQALLESIKVRLRALEAMNPYSRIFAGEFFDEMFEDEDEDDYDEDDFW